LTAVINLFTDLIFILKMNTNKEFQEPCRKEQSAERKKPGSLHPNQNAMLYAPCAMPYFI
jgi:hypothetical protein